MDIFPDKVWQNILDKLNKSEDIQAVFRAFPSLNEEEHLQRRKAFWLFEEVISIIATWEDLLGTKDLLNCRLVCRRWSSAVDKIFEEDLPLNYRNIICYYDNNRRFHVIWRLPAIWFQNQSFTTDTIVRFMDVMENNNGERNPFVSRSTSFSLILKRDYFDEMEDEENRFQFKQFEEQLICLLSKFGEHIFHFKLKLEIYSHSDREVLELIAELLCLVPNLKCLTVEGKVSEYDNTDNDIPDGIRFPRLPYLEKLNLNVYKEPGSDLDDYFPNCDYRNIIHYVLTSAYFQQQVKRHTSKEEYSIYLKVKELYMPDEVIYEGGWQTPYAEGYFEYFEYGIDRGDFYCWYSQHRYRLGDYWKSTYEVSDFLPHYARYLTSLKFEARTVSIHIIEQILKTFPYIICLEIGDDLTIRGGGAISPICGRIQSLQYLKIEDNGSFRYDFLLSFPSLRHLMICRNCTSSEDQKKRYTVVGIMKIRIQINNGCIYRSNVWSLLPNLRRVTLTHLDRVRIFFRNVWELKQKPRKERRQKEADLVEWNRDGNQYDEGVGSILESKMHVSVQNRWELLDIDDE